MWTAQITDLNLAHPEGTDVRHFASIREAKAAWDAGYLNTIFCTDYWGGALPAMTDEFTVTLWKGALEDVTDLMPNGEVVLGRTGNPVYRRIY